MFSGKYEEVFERAFEESGKPALVSSMMSILNDNDIELMSKEFFSFARENLSELAQNKDIMSFISLCRKYKSAHEKSEGREQEKASIEKKKEVEMIEARDVAKFFGGKALKGSKKQKMWAEKIRAEKLKQLGEREAKILASHYQCQDASFWIDRKDMSISELAEMCSDIGDDWIKQ